MKQFWQRISLKIDALTLRERAIIFLMAAVILVVLIDNFLLAPQFAEQHQLSQRIKQEQSQIVAIQAEIQQKVKSQAHDPNAPARARVQALQQQTMQMRATLRETQSTLVSPDKMPELLHGILKQDGKLKLVSLKTLPAESLNDATALKSNRTDEKTGSASNGITNGITSDKPERRQASEAIYKHGVEVVVEGGYLDILSYMVALEALPWKLFWGKARLNVETYPKATLTLTLFTLSLDKKWLSI